MDTLEAIAVFLEIAERGSLTAAAGSLGKSLPTVVRVLAQLERRLGVRLFHRTTRRIALTEEGRLYREHALRIRTAVADADEALTRTHADPRGHLTLTAPVRFGELYVAPLIAAFLSRYPRVELNLLLADRLLDVIDEGIDVAVRIAPLEDSALIARPVGSLRQVICASPALLATLDGPREPAGLADLPCVLGPGSGERAVWDFGHGARASRVAVRGRLSTNSIGASVAACVAGAGFGRFLCYQVAPAIARGELSVVLQQFEPPTRPLSLVYAKDGRRPARTRVLLDWLADRLPASLAGLAPGT